MGKDCVLVYDDIANWDEPTWKVVQHAVDVSQPGISKNAVSMPSRGSQGWDLKSAGLKAMNLQFGYLYHAGTDTVLAALRDSYLNDTILQFAVLDGPADGVIGRTVQGFRFAGMVYEMPETEELEDGRRFEITVEASRYVLDGELLLPEWHVIDALSEGGGGGGGGG